MKKTRAYESKPITTIGKLIELQFDAMDRSLAHVTPRQIKAYNQIVAMTKLMPKREGRR